MVTSIVNVACSGSNKAVLTVLVTLLLKKITTPSQDIRFHQARMPNGFSGRSLDSSVVTPFLRANHFPHMAESGWLTRSLEQNHPYDLDYPGSIRPREIKDAFLKTVNGIERDEVRAEHCLEFILQALIVWRDANASLVLSKPTDRRIEDIIDLLTSHWNSELSGTAKLPVLAMYAVYQCLIDDIGKYRNCELLELLSSTSADSRTDRVADIDVQNEDLFTFESVEVKHGIAITASLIEQLRTKIAGAGLKTFYVLSTAEDIPASDIPRITELLIETRRNYGCQVIVNGVACTIRYYLRLLADTDQFLIRYVSLVENDQEIPFPLKNKWNEIVG